MFSLNSVSKQATTGKSKGCPKNLQDSMERKMMGVEGDGRPREGGWWVEWSEKMPRITQKSKPRLGYGWICSTSLEKFPCKMMKLVKVLVKARNDYGRMNMEGGCLI